ncbi:MAG TPA: histidinol-phosphatase [Povalibacter sp.]|nr:histidinol-phosphatase [Povalibacter sp.]
MTTPREFTDFALHLSRIAAREILPYFRARFAIDNKAAAGFDPVTVADRNAEAAIRREIRRVYPGHGLVGEEYGSEPGTEPCTWFIDPIDGTRAFVLGQLHWGTLLALNDGSRPVLGLMHQPFTRETFIGSVNGSRLLHGTTEHKLATRSGIALSEATVCATDPTMFADPADRAAFERVAAKARSVRYGGDCYTPCLVAAGHADLVVEAGLKPWDVQPLIPIVQGAGGVITDWAGGDASRADRVVIAGNAELHAEVIAALRWSS